MWTLEYKYTAVRSSLEQQSASIKTIEKCVVRYRKLQHQNLVELYGVVTKQRPICIVTEFMEGGCLLDYIRKNKHLQTHPDTLLDMCYQVCWDFTVEVSFITIWHVKFLAC